MTGQSSPATAPINIPMSRLRPGLLLAHTKAITAALSPHPQTSAYPYINFPQAAVAPKIRGDDPVFAGEPLFVTVRNAVLLVACHAVLTG